jgi:hypothetical protein
MAAMAKDFYVGPLSAYFEGSWRSAVQPVTGKVSLPMKGILAACYWVSRRQGRARYLEWRPTIAQALDGPGFGGWTWDDSPKRPWFHARPGFDGFACLLNKYAQLLFPELEAPNGPATLKQFIDCSLYRHAKEHNAHLLALSKPLLWVPGDFSGFADFDSPNGRRLSLASTKALMQSLDDIAERWADAGAGEPELDDCALRALGLIRGLAEEAERHRLPLLHDFDAWRLRI